MKFIQTLHIDPNKNPFHDSFGWVAPEYHLMGWALSSLQLHKLYGNIILYANTKAARLLIDALHLPYSEVNVNHNADRLKHINLNIFNVFYEQHLFYALAREKDIPVNVLIDGIIKDNEYSNMGDFHDVPFNRSYLHLLGHYKRDEPTCIYMAAKLQELYPEHYDRIVALFHEKKIRLSPCGFSNPSAKRFDEKANTHLHRLKYLNDRCLFDIEKESWQSDFELFYRQLISYLQHSGPVNELSERDKAAQHWYSNLFADPANALNKVIIRCPNTEIIESSFNWAGLFNKYYRIGVAYYSDLQLTKGKFFNLIVRETTDNGFSLYDLNELDHYLLLLLSEPLSINETLLKMQYYFEDDVIQNHNEAYTNLILTSIKQLVIKKIVQPV